MSHKHYFQIKNFEYTHDAFKIGRTGVSAFTFFIIPDGHEKSTFKLQVIFPGQVVKNISGASISGTHFLTESFKPIFLRHSFNMIKEKLETSGLDNPDDIVITGEQITQMKKALPKQCDFLGKEGKERKCLSDKRHIVRTTLDSCDACIMPEPLMRCANLNVKSNWGEDDAEGNWLVTPECICKSGKTLPVDLAKCRDLECYVPFKFYLPEQEEE